MARDIAPMPCPRCGRQTSGDATELGVFFACAVCDLDWVEALALDFQTD